MKNLTCFTLITIAVFLNGCKKESDIDPFNCTDLTSNLTAVKTLISGDWEWTKSRSIGRDGKSFVYTPKDANYNDYIRVKGGTIEFARSTGEYIKRTFKILQEKDVTN